MFDQWNTGTKRKRVSKFEDDQIARCPCCHQDNESLSHLLRCRENPSRDIRIKSLKQSLKFNSFNPALQVFASRVLAWLNEEASEVHLDQYPKKFRSGLTHALQDQDAIGWDSAMKGYLSVEWQHLFAMGQGDTEAKNAVVGMQRFKEVLDIVYCIV